MSRWPLMFECISRGGNASSSASFENRGREESCHRDPTTKDGGLLDPHRANASVRQRPGIVVLWHKPPQGPDQPTDRESSSFRNPFTTCLAFSTSPARLTRGCLVPCGL